MRLPWGISAVYALSDHTPLGDRETGGRAPTRYAAVDTLRSVAEAHRRCHLLDLVQTLEVADELREITSRKHRAHRLQSPSVAELAAVRITALWSAFWPVVMANTLDGHAWVHACEETDALLLDDLRVLTAWTDQQLAWIAALRDATRRDSRPWRSALIRAETTRAHLAAIEHAVADAARQGAHLIARPAQPSPRCVSASTAVELSELAPYLTAAARESERADTFATHRALLVGVRTFSAAEPVRITGPRHGAFAARIRVDRVDALASLYRALPVARAGTLIASATELLGRVVRDRQLLMTIRDESRPSSGASPRTHAGAAKHPSVWRAAVVALGLLGEMPDDLDWFFAGTASDGDCAAVCLAPALAEPHRATKTVASLPVAARRSRVVDHAGRRLAFARLMTVVG